MYCCGKIASYKISAIHAKIKVFVLIKVINLTQNDKQKFYK